jgi:cell fate regulator YaaT (PSP1 superfamily)
VRNVAGVVFTEGGKLYQFDAGDLHLQPGDQVIVDTAKGHNLGKVVRGSEQLGESSLPPGLKTVVRMATPEDIEQVAANRADELEARRVCDDLIAELGLQMKIVSAEVTFDGGKVVFSFFSEERVDFRELVGKLADRLRRRVELRQVSARDEARLIGGYGSCGRRLCCTLFAGDQEPVSIRMAKDQNLPLNPSKISGVCGRLMCCLKYERDTYVGFKQRAPKRGSTVSTPAGTGKVVELLATSDSVSVDLGEGRVVTYTLAELRHDQENTDER